MTGLGLTPPKIKEKKRTWRLRWRKRGRGRQVGVELTSLTLDTGG